MQKAFTMIELIFVIVIIGILAAIAIPKLSVTRSDAEGASIVTSLASCINDVGNQYMMSASFNHYTQDDNATSNCRRARECFTFTENDNNGTLTIANIASSEKKCIEAQRIAGNNLLTTSNTINF